jgi:hypothetical protein
VRTFGAVVRVVVDLQWWRRAGDGGLGCMSLACVWSVVVWLIIWRRVSVIVGLVF